MCIGIPGKVIKIVDEGKSAIVDFEGTKQKIRVDLIENLNEGDYILNHVGYAIEKISDKEAEDRLEVVREYLNGLKL